MRQRKIAVIIIVAILGSLAILAHIPSPKPTQQAITNVENNPKFASVVTSNGTFFYEGFTNHPYSLSTCSLSSIVTFFSPFHEYATTTLLFMVQPNMSKFESGQIAGPLIAGPFGQLLVQVNPSNGQILNLKLVPICT